MRKMMKTKTVGLTTLLVVPLLSAFLFFMKATPTIRGDDAVARAIPQEPSVRVLAPRELKTWMDRRQPLLLVDARPGNKAYQTSHLPSAIHLPWQKPLKTVLSGSDRSLPLVIYCEDPRPQQARHCLRAIAQGFEAGYKNVFWLKGGMTAWESNGYPLEPQRNSAIP
ncbi:MAG: rhodanese-like domain-containing protein [Candidatus Methylomirabilales bacterium]